MGCISSKHVTISPLPHSSLTQHSNPIQTHHHHSPQQNKYNDQTQHQKQKQNHDDDNRHNDDYTHPRKPSFTFSVRFGRSTVAEHVAAGWPAWLSAVAGEAIDGWIPLKSDNFERCEKVRICNTTDP